MGVSYLVDLGGTEAKLNAFAKALDDLTPFWESVADPLVRGWMREQFDTEGEAGGDGKWADLSPVTKALKKRAGRLAMGILRNTDTLYRSLVFRSDPNQIKDVTPTTFTFGTSVQANGVPYPYLHQTGYTMNSIFGHALKAPHSVLPRRIIPRQLPSTWSEQLSRAFAQYAEDLAG